MQTHRLQTAFSSLFGSFSSFSVVLACLSMFFGNVAVGGDDWMTWSSTYTHEPVSGQRVDQYAKPVEPLAQRRADFQRSGYRHTQSILQGGNSSDNMHIVEQWEHRLYLRNNGVSHSDPTELPTKPGGHNSVWHY